MLRTLKTLNMNLSQRVKFQSETEYQLLNINFRALKKGYQYNDNLGIYSQQNEYISD